MYNFSFNAQTTPTHTTDMLYLLHGPYNHICNLVSSAQIFVKD